MSAHLPDGRRGAVLALCITLIALAVLWLGLVEPALDWFAERQATLARQAQLLQRMQTLAESLPQLRAQAGATAPVSGSGAAALPGDSDAIAAAGLQQRLDDLARRRDTRIASSETLASEAAGPWRSIAVRVTMEATWSQLTALLTDIAAAPTTMVVDNLQLRGPARDGGDVDQIINVAFSVMAWRRGAGGP